jgi:hypothetical protein
MNLIKYSIIFFCLVFGCQNWLAKAQNKFFTRTGVVVFYSKAPIEDIKAINNQVGCIYETESNRIVANVLIRAFEFDKTLMQQHFNENYMESDKFPKATFKGKLLNIQNIDFKSNWTKSIEFEGDMTIHGVTKKINSIASISCENGNLSVITDFNIFIKDFDIKIPSTLINNIAEKINIKVNLKLSELNK